MSAGKSADAHLASDVADKSLQDPKETSKAADSAANAREDDEGEDEEAEDEVEGDQPTEAGAEGASSTKKKKPKKKKKKAASAEDTAGAAQTQAAPNVNQARDIQNLLQQLAMSNQQGKRVEGKKPEDYKFWNTQPVPKFKEPDLLQTTDDAQAEGPILPSKICRAAAKAEPEKLLDGFEWCLVDLDNDKELEELYELLDNHYVEDTDGSFRFKYSKQFLSWALKPPGWRRDWHIGVRTATKEGKKGKLVAFIAGIPVTLKTGDQKFEATEINFLTIHRRLRGKRLAPVLIKEVTRQCYLNDIYQALYTAGTLLPTPITTGRYYHRSLDWEHLYKTGFSHLPQGSSEMRQKFKYKLESQTATKGLRPMKSDDVPAVMDLLVRYLERFHLRQEWSREEIEHWLCSAASEGVVWSFVVEDENKKITDFISYYLLEVSLCHPHAPKFPT